MSWIPIGECPAFAPHFRAHHAGGDGGDGHRLGGGLREGPKMSVGGPWGSSSTYRCDERVSKACHCRWVPEGVTGKAFKSHEGIVTVGAGYLQCHDALP